MEDAAADQPRPADAGRVCTGQGACARAQDEVPAPVIYWRGGGRPAPATPRARERHAEGSPPGGGLLGMAVGWRLHLTGSCALDRGRSRRRRRACSPHSSNGASLIAVRSAPYLFTNFARPWGTRTASARNASANAFLTPTRGESRTAVCSVCGRR